MAGRIDLICVDPGLRNTGVAHLVYGCVETITLLERAAVPFEQNLYNQVKALRSWADCNTKRFIAILERPRIYRTKNVRQNDQMDLSLFAGGLGAALLTLDSCSGLHFFTPLAWKGQTPKAIQNSRTLAQHLELKPQLQEYPKGKHEHIIDAVGLGDYYLKELGHE